MDMGVEAFEGHRLSHPFNYARTEDTGFYPSTGRRCLNAGRRGVDCEWHKPVCFVLLKTRLRGGLQQLTCLRTDESFTRFVLFPVWPLLERAMRKPFVVCSWVRSSSSLRPARFDLALQQFLRPSKFKTKGGELGFPSHGLPAAGWMKVNSSCSISQHRSTRLPATTVTGGETM